MANQLPQATLSEEFSIARQVMDDVADYYLANGGPTAARDHVEKAAKVLLIYDDCTEAYLATMARISMAEKAERQKAEERQQQMQSKMIAMIKGAKSEQPASGKPSDNKSEQNGTEPQEIVLPQKLSSEKAMRIWQKLQEANFVDEYFQPIGLTRTEVALLAEQITIQLADENDNLLDIKEWKPYETLWRRKNMKADLRRALTQDKTSEFRDKIKRLFLPLS